MANGEEKSSDSWGCTEIRIGLGEDESEYCKEGGRSVSRLLEYKHLEKMNDIFLQALKGY